MKKLYKAFSLGIILCIVLVLVFGLCKALKGDGKQHLTLADTSNGTLDKLDVVVTSFPIYDFVRHISSDRANITMLIDVDKSMHDYVYNSSDFDKIKNADIFICEGISDDKLIEKAGSNTKVIKLNDSINCTDEHMWLSINDSKKAVKEIYTQLLAMDKNGEEIYTTNFISYTDQLDTLSKNFEQVVHDKKRDKLAIASKMSMKIITDEYNLEYCALVSDCYNDVKIDKADTKDIEQYIFDKGLKSVIYIDETDKDIADRIASNTSSSVFKFNTLHTISRDDFDNGKTYIDIMMDNLNTLKTALQ